MLDEALAKIKNKKLVFGIGGALLTTFIAFSYILTPTEKQIKAIKEDYEKLRSKGSVLQSIGDLKVRMEGYRQLFPSSAEGSKIIDDLNALANKSQLTILSMAPSSPVKLGEGFEQVQVTISLEGSFHDLGKYVSAVESMKYLVKIASLDFSSREESDNWGRGQIPMNSKIDQRLNMVVAFFYFPTGAAG